MKKKKNNKDKNKNKEKKKICLFFPWPIPGLSLSNICRGQDWKVDVCCTCLYQNTEKLEILIDRYRASKT